MLLQAGFPAVIIRHQDRLRYYDTLQAANEGDTRPFVRFISHCTDKTIDVYLWATRDSHALTGDHQALLGSPTPHLEHITIEDRMSPASGNTKGINFIKESEPIISDDLISGQDISTDRTIEELVLEEEQIRDPDPELRDLVRARSQDYPSDALYLDDLGIIFKNDNKRGPLTWFSGANTGDLDYTRWSRYYSRLYSRAAKQDIADRRDLPHKENKINPPNYGEIDTKYTKEL